MKIKHYYHDYSQVWIGARAHSIFLFGICLSEEAGFQMWLRKPKIK